jgi:hypothetical protein
MRASGGGCSASGVHLGDAAPAGCLGSGRARRRRCARWCHRTDVIAPSRLATLERPQVVGAFLIKKSCALLADICVPVSIRFLVLRCTRTIRHQNMPVRARRSDHPFTPPFTRPRAAPAEGRRRRWVTHTDTTHLLTHRLTTILTFGLTLIPPAPLATGLVSTPAGPKRWHERRRLRTET